MKKLLVVLLLVGLAYGGYRAALGIAAVRAEHAAYERVRMVLQASKDRDEQTALCMWARGMFTIGMDEIASFERPWAKFKTTLRLDTMRDFFVLTSEYSKEDAGVFVAAEIDGRSLQFFVTPDAPVELWE